MIRIVTFCNKSYVPVLKNWLLALDKIGLKQHALVITLDNETHDAIDFCDTLHRPIAVEGKNFSGLWQHRLEILDELLQSYDEIIHSDADAVWLRNPLPMISSLNSNITFTQGTVWPHDVHTLHGVVLCCGLFYLNNSSEARHFLKQVRKRVENDNDDQISVNREVASRINGWQIKEPLQIPFRETTFTTSKEVMRSIAKSESDDLNICVLPHHLFPRLVETISDDVYIAHPLSGKTLDEKAQCLSELGIWWS
ncbi:putative nucleotide-diphospho-sugar transferase [Alteromonas sp. 1_MG-2023]|uniref:putative nucleotide-diphospho-sugar transferase n=1 Tax=Alteromonas sp. 1_MG-2023 TaxID=3062669 RepID=UPI0026E1363E|nr:putative nucleotide-diphospho-sugar transferase [Alteromonas sp. 1_MG-2023]MDO6567906.1 putative nucleotide-diphospho-sugar transferase [Alteromonas sp. 1_MG-2023]